MHRVRCVFDVKQFYLIQVLPTDCVNNFFRSDVVRETGVAGVAWLFLSLGIVDLLLFLPFSVSGGLGDARDGTLLQSGLKTRFGLRS